MHAWVKNKHKKKIAHCVLLKKKKKSVSNTNAYLEFLFNARTENKAGWG